MAGTVIRVAQRRTLNFTSVSSGSGQAEEVMLAEGIDLFPWSETSLVVRAHSTSFGGNIGQIDIYALPDSRTAEDPGILFVNTSALAIVTITSSTVAPFYAVTGCPYGLGGAIKIAAKGTRTSSLGSNLIRADVSVELSLKSP